jgi:hypothetical protein
MKRPRNARTGFARPFLPFLPRFLTKSFLATFVAGAMFSSMVVGTQAAGAVQSVIQNFTAAIMTNIGVADDATNTLGLTQVDGGGLVNQSGAFDPVLAGSSLMGSATITAANTDTTTQTAADGPNAQSIEETGDADTDVMADLSSNALNDLTGTQVAGPGGNINQDFTHGATAESNLLADIIAGALNVFNLGQTAGPGPNAQSTMANSTADTNGTETVTAFGGNVANTTQIVAGPLNHNQHIGNIFNAITNVTVLQNLFSTNNTNVNVIGGTGPNSQNVTVNTFAITNGDLGVDVTALNEITDMQIAGAGNNQNQNAGSDILANAVGNAAQIGTSTNTQDIDQVAGGDNAAQNADVAGNAQTDLEMDFGVNATNALGSSVVQTMGSGDNQNQDADTSAAANVNGDADQTGTSSNTSNTSQVGADNAAQGIDETLGALAQANATVDFIGLNEYELNQTEGSGDQHNQAANTSLLANVLGDVDQASVAANLSTSSQVGANNAAQGMDTTADAGSLAELDVLMAANNNAASTINQIGGSGNNHNQAADTALSAGVEGDVDQQSIGTNLLDQSQVGAGNVAQGMNTDAGAGATALGGVALLGVNAYELNQIEGSGDQHNQAADTSAQAGVLGDVDQIATALNAIDNTQVGANDVAQGMDTSANAQGLGSVGVLMLASNDFQNTLNQVGGSGDNHTQAADTALSAGVDGQVGQVISGENFLTQSQVGANTAAQGMDTTANALAGGDAGVALIASNEFTLNQIEGAGDQHNQSADTTAGAGVLGDVHQISTALNGVDQSQVGANQAAQGMDTLVEATGFAQLGAVMLASNDFDNTLNQVGGSGNNHNQAADTSLNAGVDGTIGQVAVGTNFLDQSQVGANQAAQGMDTEAQATGLAQAGVALIAGNEFTLNQIEGAGDQHNQAADTSGTAGVDGTVNQISTALNAIEGTQVGANNAAQGMDTDADAASLGILGVLMLAGNDFDNTINQFGGSGNNHNQSADTVLGAGVDGEVAQVVSGENFIGQSQVGANNAAQGMDTDVGAQATGLAQIGMIAGNEFTLNQIEGAGDQHNQSAATSGTAGVDGEVGQIVTALNAIGSSQVGADNAAQGMDTEADAGVLSGLAVLMLAENDFDDTINQIGGSGNNHNQAADTGLNAGVGGAVGQTAVGSNLVGQTQVGADNVAQGMDTDVGVEVVALAEIVMNAENTYTLNQIEGSGNQHNQAADTVANAGVEGTVGQASVALNDIEGIQVGTGNAAQGMDTVADAGAVALLGVEMTAFNDLGSSINQMGGAGDNHNLSAGTQLGAGAGGQVGQNNAAVNNADQVQVGADNSAQGISNDLSANANASAGVGILAGNSYELNQLAGAGDQHNLSSTLDAVALAQGEIAQNNVGVNDVGQVQVGVGQAAQGMDNDLDVNANAGLLAFVLAGNNVGSTVNQMSGTGDNHNLSSEIETLADADGEFGQNNAAVNSLGQTQVGVGQAAQGMENDLDSTAVALMLAGVEAGNEIKVNQNSGTGDQHNLGSSILAGAQADGSIGQSNTAFNGVGQTQVGTDQAAQGMENDLDSTATAGLLASVVARNNIGSTVTQNAGVGDNHNLSSDIDADAQVNGGVTQGNTAANILTQGQIGVGQAAQGMTDDLDAVANADAEVVFVGLNAIETVQNSGVGDQHNLAADTDASVNVGADVDQDNVAVNTLVATQVGTDGAAQGLNNTLNANADANLRAGIFGSNDIGSTVMQNSGTGNQHNLAADTNAMVNVGGDVDQDNTASNTAIETQVGTDQVAQGMDASLSAIANADAEIGIVGLNEIKVVQNSGTGNNHNLAADTNATVNVGGDVDQDNTASNTFVGTQVGTDQVAQGQDVNAVANADADLGVTIAGINAIGSSVVQNSGTGKNHNLAADTNADATVAADIDQDNDAVNTVIGTQVASGNGAQNSSVTPTANANANLLASVIGLNEIETTQNSGAGNQHNQSADTDADADVSAGIGQTNLARNTVVDTQVCTGPVCAQNMNVAPTANANANLGATVAGVNNLGSTTTQNGGAGNNQNQSAGTDTQSTVGADIGQNNMASNDVDLTEVCAGIVCALYMQVDPTANANAGLNADVVSGNEVSNTQNGGTGNNQNQALANDADADANATITQNNTGMNTVNATQGCSGIVCAMGMFINPTVNANANTNANVAATNEIGNTQNGGAGDQHNQAVANEAGAEVDATITQNNLGKNVVNANQTCGSTVCAGFVGINPLVNANATLDADTDATNEIGNTQNGGTGNNQNQAIDNGTTAANNTGVTQNNTGMNTVNVTQTCGSPTCAQAANVNPTANATSNMNLGTTAGNTLNNTQNGGAGNNRNQALNNALNATNNTNVTANNNAANNVTTTQTSGATPGNQSATTNATANSNSTFNINTGATNTVTNTQN